MLEVELKVSLAGQSLAALENALAEQGFTPACTLRETDLYFNGGGRDFRETDEALRLRRVQRLPEGPAETLITYKGPKTGGLAKSRTEYETAVGDQAVMGAVLEALGFRPVHTVEKTRRELTAGAVTACLDEVAGLGAFLELELLVEADREAAAERLLALLDRLGVPRENLTRRSYLEMLTGDK